MSSSSSKTLQYLEYAPVATMARVLEYLPRPCAQWAGQGIAEGFYRLHRRLTRVGRRNLELAYPNESPGWREQVLHGVYHHLGRQMAEFCRFPRYSPASLDAICVTRGLENYLEARERGQGVLILTAHLGGWEISSFVHSLRGYPLRFLVRPLDNQPLDRMVNRIRGLHGNQPINRRNFARGLLQAMAANQSVGILLDQNSYPPQGVFVPFFGHLACTAAGPARIALRTGAAVVPGFTVWEAAEKRYVLYFDPALPLLRTGDDEADVLANTAQYTAVIEFWIRRYPDQWIWMHRRWKARPSGEAGFYATAVHQRGSA